MLQITAWTAVIALLVATAIVALIGLIAVVRRSSFGSRAGRVLLSLVASVGFFIPATVLFDKVHSSTPGFRVNVGDADFAQSWDLMLAIGSTWIAIGVGWIIARFLAGRSPFGWPVAMGRVRDSGLIALFTAVLVLLFASTTGPILPTFQSPFDLNLWGVWGLGQTVPLGVFLVRRLRNPPAPVLSGNGPSRLDRFGRFFLAGYYWYAAVALPFSLWGLSVLEEELQG